MPQWMGDLLPPQVPQEGLRGEEKEDKRCEPGQEELQPQGTQGQQQLLGRHPTNVFKPPLLFNKRFCHTAHVSVITQ